LTDFGVPANSGTNPSLETLLYFNQIEGEAAKKNMPHTVAKRGKKWKEAIGEMRDRHGRALNGWGWGWEWESK